MWHHFVKAVGVSVLTVFCTVCLLSLPLLLLLVTLCQNTHMLTPSFTISLLLSILPLLPHPSLSALSFCSVVERDGVNTTVCVFPLNSGTEGDKKIVTAFGTVILFGCVLYSW